MCNVGVNMCPLTEVPSALYYTYLANQTALHRGVCGQYA